jgi:hypothetical protein
MGSNSTEGMDVCVCLCCVCVVLCVGSVLATTYILKKDPSKQLSHSTISLPQWNNKQHTYLTQNTLRLDYKNNRLIMSGEIIVDILRTADHSDRAV